MRILHIKVLDGPNYWSVQRTQLIEMKLDIGLYEYCNSSQLQGFNDRLLNMLPGLSSHCYAGGQAGGFVKKLQEGVWMGHITERVALELQTMAGMECGFGRTCATKTIGTYDVVFSYLMPNAGVYAARAAVHLVTALAGKKMYLLEETLVNLRQIFESDKLIPGIQAIVNEASCRSIPCVRLGYDSLVMLGSGCMQRRISAGMMQTTSAIGVALASKKHQAIGLMAAAGIPVTDSEIVSNETDLFHVTEEWGYPVIINPGNTTVWSWKKAKAAFIQANHPTTEVIVEKLIPGILFQVLVVNYKVVAVVKVDGTNEDVTDEAHPDNVSMAERIARLIGLDVCGISMKCSSITHPLKKVGGVVMGLTATPELHMYVRNVATAVLDMLFPEQGGACIPLVAVAATKGAADITGMIAYIAMTAGLFTAYTTTEGIFYNGLLVKEGNYNELLNARIVLMDPQVQYAILGCTNNGILNAGLGFSQCQISVVANIVDDHPGKTFEQVTVVGQVVSASTITGGYAVLNADDDQVYTMKKDLNCNIALYSLQLNCPRIRTHRDKGGLCAYLHNDWVQVVLNGKEEQVIQVQDIPAHLSEIVLAAILVGVISDFSTMHIRNGLKAFVEA